MLMSLNQAKHIFQIIKMKTQSKFPSQSETIMTEVVFPNDTNPLGFLRGGNMMHWMDIASAICAQTHANKVAVTVAVDKLTFKHPVKLGDIVTIKAKITRSFRSSMEIYVEVWAKKIPGNEPFMTNTAFYSFVALDEKAQPSIVPTVKAQTATEKKFYISALKRREERFRG